MKELLYRRLQQKIITLTLLVSFTPLVILGFTMYHQFANTYTEKTDGQIRYRARSQAEAVDRFLKERTAILGSMVDTHSFEEMVDEDNLSRIFQVMNSRCGAFVDLGVIDQKGLHLAYVGPYDLKGKSYFDQPWFAEAVSKGVYKSDVFMGYRKQPHFIIAVRRHEMQNPWILRATIDPDILGEIVRSAHIGRTGDTYIINRQGVYQTKPRFKGKILSAIDLDPNQFGGQVEVVEKRNEKGRAMLYAGSWLKDDKLLLVVQQEPDELIAGLLAVRFAEFAIITCGLIAIVVTTIFTTSLAIKHLKKSDDQMSALNAELVQSDKLASLGKLAAGVAHEINNPLAVILQKTGWMEDLLHEEEFQKSENLEEFQMSVQKIEAHVERAKKVVHNMLGYARKMEPRLEDVDVNETLNRTIDLLENYSRNNNIEIQAKFADAIPIIASDQAQLQQVFLNLMTNAIDAIAKDGLIEVATRCSASMLYIDIADDGPGMPEETQKRVFDPFFTTKETGRGTGLGLWVTFNIIEKMGGTIRVESQVGKGTRFTVEIPIVKPERK